MFTHDRHLIALEPNLPRDVAWIGQRLVKGTGDIAGATLTMTSQDVGFDIVGVEPGNIVLAGPVVYEVIDVLDNTSLTISRLRADDDASLLPPSPATGVEVSIPSYLPQIAIAHRQTLHLLGLDPAGDGPTEESITNPGDLTLLEALGALHLIFTAAAALAPDSPHAARAALYRDRYAAERARAAARIDTTGDGRPDATRRPAVIPLARA